MNPTNPLQSPALDTNWRNDSGDQMLIDSASVKVMRSHDYCHFEVVLGCAQSLTVKDVDDLRKTAARLADKAVEQYKIAKADAQKQMYHERDRADLVRRMEFIRSRPEQERTIEEQAQLKAFDDANYQARRAYDYEDDWDEPDYGDEDTAY